MMSWAVIGVLGAVGVGIFIGRSWADQVMLGQEAAHKTQMDELAAELKRARTQVANLIGKE